MGVETERVCGGRRKSRKAPSRRRMNSEVLSHTGRGLEVVSFMLMQHHKEYLHFRAVSGWGKIPLASKSCISHSGAPSVFHVQKIQPVAFS
jgi:hypothetical protein